MKVVIIGNGIAGINVAQALRNAEAKGSPCAEPLSIEVFAAEAHPFYSRIRLPEVLSGETDPDGIVFYKPDWYEKKAIAVRTGCPISSVDADSRRVTLLDGSSVPYDRLVLATGSFANHPPIPGSRLPGVFTLRTMDDAKAIRENAKAHPASASVIGGGLLGLEAARALKDAGVAEVRVFEIFARLLPRQLDETGAAMLKARFLAQGIEVVTSAETAEFPAAADGSNRAGFVRLKDGREFPSDTTVLSMGVKPNVELASSIGLAINRGIVVDSSMRTSDPYIYAVGDCAEFQGVVWGIIPAALEQAPVAARAILASCGMLPETEATPYAQTVPKTSLKVADVELLSMGKAILSPEEEASGSFETLSRALPDEGRYEKYVLSRGEGDTLTLVGAIVYGFKKHQAIAQKLMGKPVTRAEIEGLLDE